MADGRVAQVSQSSSFAAVTAGGTHRGWGVAYVRGCPTQMSGYYLVAGESAIMQTLGFRDSRNQASSGKPVGKSLQLFSGSCHLWHTLRNVLQEVIRSGMQGGGLVSSKGLNAGYCGDLP